MNFNNIKNAELIINAAENLDFSLYINDDGIEFGKYSPAGEDFLFYIEVKDNDSVGDVVNRVKEYADDFDEEEHIEMWVKVRIHSSVNGVPSIKVLVKDAEDIYDMLQELANTLLDTISNMEETYK